MKIIVKDKAALMVICGELQAKYPDHANMHVAIKNAKAGEYYEIFNYLTAEEKARAGMEKENFYRDTGDSASVKLFKMPPGDQIRHDPKCEADPDNFKQNGEELKPDGKHDLLHQRLNVW